MNRVWIAALALAGASLQTIAAQDAKTVIGNASKAMGVEGLNSIYYYGVAQNGNLGQNNNSNQPWPMAGANDYVRAIDFNQRASRATWVNYGAPVTGGPATQTPGQQNINAQSPWAQQVEIYITPWGFLKGAAGNDATVKAQTVGGKRYQVVSVTGTAKAPSGQPYKVVGYINSQNLVEKVQTWLENPIFGDMLIEAEYTHYRNGANGLKFPAQMVQKRGGWPTFTAYILGAHANPANLSELMAPPQGGRGGRGGGGGAPGGGGQAAAGSTSEKLADGVFRINGAYNSMAIEFADHILLFEPGPQNEARAQAVIAEAKRVIPNKPIRYGVISHHHFDHTSGLPAVVAEGITIVTPEVNRDFLMTTLSAPRTLAPDSMSKSGKKPVIEGFKGDKRVFQDASRTFEVHVIKGLPHADGLVIGYLPKEKILVYADMFNLPPPNDPVPNPPVIGTMVFLDNIERLKLEPERVMSIHSLNPDRLTTVAEMKASLGRK
jgi:glyoxylase-like metal-dependent hydrolase (beta-lactamase superfamily II)